MSLVNYSSPKPKRSWSDRDLRSTQHKLPDIQQPQIDYQNLSWLCNIDGIRRRGVKSSTEEAHQYFMQNYKKMFIQPEKRVPIELSTHASNHSLKKSLESFATLGSFTDETDKQNKVQDPVESFSHDIRDYTKHLRRERKSEVPEAVKNERIKTLRRLLRKFSFERTSADNNTIYKVVKTFPSIANQVPANVLKELCVVAQIDIWREPDFTVFGGSGLHMLLKGSVSARSSPHLWVKGTPKDFRVPTPEPAIPVVLRVGECFGTLEKLENRDPNSKMLSVQTLEPGCEFLKISASDYTRVIQQISQRDKTEKMNLLQSCSSYRLWPAQPLVKVASLIDWISFPANTVIVSEGYKAPFIAFIKSGECHILRQLDVLHTLPNGKKEKRSKQVVMGKLSECQSFGEISVLQEEPITCTIVAATSLELGVVDAAKLEELDSTTLQLLTQSNERTFGNLTKDDIHQEYMEQELKREWNEFKHGVVVESINAKGIRPGYGKWAK